MKPSKLLLVAAVLFLGYLMFQDPNRFADLIADAVTGAWSLVTRLFDQIIVVVSQSDG